MSTAASGAALDIDRDDAWLTFAGICRREKNSRERDDAESRGDRPVFDRRVRSMNGSCAAAKVEDSRAACVG